MSSDARMADACECGKGCGVRASSFPAVKERQSHQRHREEADGHKNYLLQCSASKDMATPNSREGIAHDDPFFPSRAEPENGALKNECLSKQRAVARLTCHPVSANLALMQGTRTARQDTARAACPAQTMDKGRSC